jgi:hypothetical protein
VKKDSQRALVIAIGVILLVSVYIGLFVMRSSFEAAAYNRATGSNVSTWDAMWIELRVQAEPKR